MTTVISHFPSPAGPGGLNPDAQAWIDAVNAVSTFDNAYAQAVSDLFDALQADVYYDLIEDLYIFGGANDFTGAVVPAKGSQAVVVTDTGSVINYNKATGFSIPDGTSVLNANIDFQRPGDEIGASTSDVSVFALITETPAGYSTSKYIFNISGTAGKIMWRANSTTLVRPRLNASSGNVSVSYSTPDLLTLDRHSTADFDYMANGTVNTISASVAVSGLSIGIPSTSLGTSDLACGARYLVFADGSSIVNGGGVLTSLRTIFLDFAAAMAAV